MTGRAGGPDELDWPLVSAVIPTKDRPAAGARRPVRARSGLPRRHRGDHRLRRHRTGGPGGAAAGRPEHPAADQQPDARAGRQPQHRLPGRHRRTRRSCDDDDEWLPSKMRVQVGLRRLHPQASAAASGFVYRYRDNDLPREAPLNRLTFEDLIQRPAPGGQRLHLPDPAPATLLAEIGLVDEQLPGSYAEDYELLLRAARQGPIVCAQRPLSRVYLHDSLVLRQPLADHQRRAGLPAGPGAGVRRDPAGLARIEGQIAFANAALGTAAGRPVGVAVAAPVPPAPGRATLPWWWPAGLMSADRVLASARRFGRGI